MAGVTSTIITHPRSREIVAAVGRGESVVSIAEKYRVSPSAIYRFRRSNYARATLQSVQDSPEPLDYVDALAASIRDADTVRRAALARGDERGVIRAADSVGKLSAMLLSRLALDSEDAAAYAVQDSRLAGALLTLVAQDPTLGERLITVLDEQGHRDLADEIEAFAGLNHDTRKGLGQ